MWGVDPQVLCRKHLLGEHVEMHMFMGSLQKGIGLGGYVNAGFVEVHSVEQRHDELAQEMARRGYNHQSPAYEDVPYYEAGVVDVQESYDELKRRCSECHQRIVRTGSPLPTHDVKN